ncbi:CdaR family transcriptional regulator [Tepidanaerobacter syntrophicus]|uniref:Carbohydrate diacid regulator n=1 Tax=Tepidanaerobacter syntrophicus TaxID=224999 RepID=A0A0U9HM64_9FIRM|nr:sugar diacid recognition domain-containing protein [Tepidanaerobacter syntrophicus]GAQ24023.1 carbohydrate diacid regulator [Tepidanaerobacter syntrophicus]GLI19474.1 CdaR family transcriptional regulator [Tepidanaerobacter syntrophicus]GLI51661.1 CdaR family transcriptional regulator [Tepidanaerobacter syntrophicus]HHV84163.1 transcriptional regulator CdaR [Tepidanaerobacter syntrophicus]
MEITHEYAQSIVEKTKDLLGKNINIMNSLGIIVGSGDKSRIDTYHEGAAEVIKTGKSMEITSEQAEKLEGVKPGVNLPVYLNDRIVGVVGITGEPDEVRPFGQLLKISVETMLNQIFLSEQLRMEQNAKELYVNDIINGNIQDINAFLTKGQVFGFDMTIYRIALAVKIKESINTGHKKLASQEIQEKILACIKNVFNNPQHMVSHNGSNNYIVLYATDETDPEFIKEELSKTAEILKRNLSKYSATFSIGVGSYYPGLSGIRKSYKEAVKALQLQEKILKGSQTLPELIFASDIALEMMLSAVPEEIIDTYIDQVVSKGEAKTFLKDTKLTTTLKTYFSSNLNISKTAKTLNVTRNTVSSRLEKIKELTGLDPSDFNDALKLDVLLRAVYIKEI